MNLSAAQQNALKDLAILGVVYLGAKTTSAVLRYGIIGVVGFLLWKNYQSTQNAALSGGWKVKVDPGMAVDMLFPKMGVTEKQYAKAAANHIMNGLLPQGFETR